MGLILPSIKDVTALKLRTVGHQFLSKISAASWNLTPHHSNYVKTLHAGHNAETAIHVQLLTGILQAKERDRVKAAELALIIRNGVMLCKWNGIDTSGGLHAEVESLQYEFGAGEAAFNNSMDTYNPVPGTAFNIGDAAILLDGSATVDRCDSLPILQGSTTNSNLGHDMSGTEH
ncbi:hypothetical protein B0H19DRAFT_1256703 [Mycena capillaripes]|nr:hypothetical protein B0H19DRAFT_1256703 [Mycena capillaripes]